MHDVARLAGVSIATVSAVINNTAVVSPTRAQKVREAMKALDYHADQVARSLKTGRTNVIGMVIPDVTNAFYPDVISGAEEIATRAGYSLILCNANEDPVQEQRLLSTLFSRRVDGVLIACSDSSTAYDSLMRRRFPIVFFDRIPTGFRGAAVATDNLAAGYQATRHLIELGHERIAIIAGNMELSPHAFRSEGYRKAMQEAGLPVHNEYFRIGALKVDNGYQFGLELLGLAARPTAIFCTNNKMLLGLVRAIGELKVNCPAEVSIVGVDDFTWTENFNPKLTTVAQPSRDIGRKAMELLLEQVGADKENLGARAQRQVILAPELRIRNSTARPASPSQRLNALAV